MWMARAMLRAICFSALPTFSVQPTFGTAPFAMQSTASLQAGSVAALVDFEKAIAFSGYVQRCVGMIVGFLRSLIPALPALALGSAR